MNVELLLWSLPACILILASALMGVRRYSPLRVVRDSDGGAHLVQHQLEVHGSFAWACFCESPA